MTVSNSTLGAPGGPLPSSYSARRELLNKAKREGMASVYALYGRAHAEVYDFGGGDPEIAFLHGVMAAIEKMPRDNPLSDAIQHKIEIQQLSVTLEDYLADDDNETNKLCFEARLVADKLIAALSAVAGNSVELYLDPIVADMAQIERLDLADGNTADPVEKARLLEARYAVERHMKMARATSWAGVSARARYIDWLAQKEDMHGVSCAVQALQADIGALLAR